MRGLKNDPFDNRTEVQDTKEHGRMHTQIVWKINVNLEEAPEVKLKQVTFAD